TALSASAMKYYPVRQSAFTRCASRAAHMVGYGPEVNPTGPQRAPERVRDAARRAGSAGSLATTGSEETAQGVPVHRTGAEGRERRLTRIPITMLRHGIAGPFRGPPPCGQRAVTLRARSS